MYWKIILATIFFNKLIVFNTICLIVLFIIVKSIVLNFNFYFINSSYHYLRLILLLISNKHFAFSFVFFWCSIQYFSRDFNCCLNIRLKNKMKIVYCLKYLQRPIAAREKLKKIVKNVYHLTNYYSWCIIDGCKVTPFLAD